MVFHLVPSVFFFFIHQGGMVQALSIHRKWKGYTFDYEGSQKLVFRLKEPNYSCLLRNNAIRVSTEPRRSNKDWDFEIKGYFPDRSCSIVDHLGNIVAQVYNLRSTIGIQVFIYSIIAFF